MLHVENKTEWRKIKKKNLPAQNFQNIPVHYSTLQKSLLIYFFCFHLYYQNVALN